ncbi:MAG: phenylacetate--CoA ligase family protein, partial [Thermoleophilia bacterium]|nr:phenylacetate--CoA ligase family protein [Thermoleophilia bacterium]
GVSVRMPRSTIGSRMVVPDARSHGPFYRCNLAERQLYLSATHLSPKNLPEYLRGLNRFKPKVFTGYAHSHYLLARLMLESNSRLEYRPEAAILGSDKITPQMRRTMAEAFDTRVFEEYGSVENCVLATECEEGSLHVSPDFGILEILDDQDRPVGPGEVGRLVCTGLLNETQPLIRYEIGDLGTWSRQGCPCGRSHMPVLEGIVGRVRDVVLMRDGRRITVATGPIFALTQGVIEGQIVQQDYDDFVIRVVATAGFGPHESARLEKQLRQRVGDVHVTVQSVESLEKTSAGKSKAVISRVLESRSESAQMTSERSHRRVIEP